MTLGKTLNVSIPQFPCLKMQITVVLASKGIVNTQWLIPCILLKIES